MMKIEVIRHTKENGKWYGKLYVNGDYFCDTVELAATKVYKHLRCKLRRANHRLCLCPKKNSPRKFYLPAGTYDLELTSLNKLSYVKKIMYYNMLEFGIPVIKGNKLGDIECCIKVLDEETELYRWGVCVTDRLEYRHLYDILLQAFSNNEKLTFTIS